MRILVTGGTVFASRAAAEYMADAGHEVFVLNRGTKPQPPGTSHICGDRHNLAEKLKQYCFDAVLDMTAYTAEDVNDLLDALGDFGTYVLLSSSAVYPEMLPQPFSEEMPLGENKHWGDYGLGKIGAESALLSRVPDAYIIRPPYLCGAYRGGADNLYREAFVFECADKGLPFYLPANCGLQLQFSHIGDVCCLIEQILQHRPDTHIFNTGYAESVSAEDWVRLCCAIAGAPCEIRTAPEYAPLRAYFPFRDYTYTLDVSRQNAFAPPRTPLDESLRQYYRLMHETEIPLNRKPFFTYISEHFEH